jgi:hypothetical protein
MVNASYGGTALARIASVEHLNSAALAAHNITCRGKLVMYCIRVCNKKLQKIGSQTAFARSKGT